MAVAQIFGDKLDCNQSHRRIPKPRQLNPSPSRSRKLQAERNGAERERADECQVMRAGLDAEGGQAEERLDQKSRHGGGRQKGESKMKRLRQPRLALARLRSQITKNR